MSMLQSCMGGHCKRRERCLNYHAASPSQEPEERICVQGKDGKSDTYRVVMHRAAGEWGTSRAALAAAAQATWSGI